MSLLKELVRTRAPRAFAALQRARRQVELEARVIRRINFFDFIRQTLPAGNSWRTELPVLRPQIDRLSTHFPAERSGRSVYLDPRLWRGSDFADSFEL